MEEKIESISETDFFKIQGSNLYFFDDLIFVDNTYYNQFYNILDAYNYYSIMHKFLNKDIVFIFENNTYIINDKTDFNIINSKYEQNCEFENKKTDGVNIKKIYINYLKKKKDSLYRLFYMNNKQKEKVIKI